MIHNRREVFKYHRSIRRDNVLHTTFGSLFVEGAGEQRRMGATEFFFGHVLLCRSWIGKCTAKAGRPIGIHISLSFRYIALSRIGDAHGALVLHSRDMTEILVL